MRALVTVLALAASVPALEACLRQPHVVINNYYSAPWPEQKPLLPGEGNASVLTPPSHKYGSVVVSSIAAPIPATPSWGNGQTIYLDPANASTHASDSNDCLTSSTPCLSWNQFVVRWGGYATLFDASVSSATSIVALSTEPTNLGEKDPIIWFPYVNSTGGTVPTVTLTCALSGAQVVASGTMGTVTAKNRTLSTPVWMSIASFTGGTPNAGDLIVNSTHASNAIVMGTSASTFLYQPQTNTGFVPQGTFGATIPTEVDTTATGDSYTEYAPCGLNLVLIHQTAISNATAQNSNAFVPLVIQYIHGLYPPSGRGNLGSASSPVVLDGQLLVADSTFDRFVTHHPTGTYPEARFVDNQYGLGYDLESSQFPVNSSGSPDPNPDIASKLNSAAVTVFGGGEAISPATEFGSTLRNAWPDNDFFMAQASGVTVSLRETVSLGCVAVGNSAIVAADDGAHVIAAGTTWGGACSTQNIIWNSGVTSTSSATLITLGQSRWTWTVGDTAATTFFGNLLLRIGTRTNTTACSHSNANNPDVTNCGITFNVANLDTAQGTGGFGDQAFIPGLGSWGNTL